MLPVHGVVSGQYVTRPLRGGADRLPKPRSFGDGPMDVPLIWVLGSSFAVLSTMFGYTHVRINQVRSEAIDIADRNKRDVNTVADLLRAEFTMRMSKLEDIQERNRVESRSDMTRMQDGQERFRDEIRETLKDMKADIIDAVGGRSRGRHMGPSA